MNSYWRHRRLSYSGSSVRRAGFGRWFRLMFFDLDVPVPEPALSPPPTASTSGGGKKGKQKAQQPAADQDVAPKPAPLLFNAAQIAAIETRIEILAQRASRHPAAALELNGRVSSGLHGAGIIAERARAD